jgi:hypothetical protein
MRYLVYDERIPDVGSVQIKVTEDEAIKIQRDSAWKSKGYIYETDQMALDDYIAVNWAYWKEEL